MNTSLLRAAAVALLFVVSMWGQGPLSVRVRDLGGSAAPTGACESGARYTQTGAIPIIWQCGSGLTWVQSTLPTAAETTTSNTAIGGTYKQITTNDAGLSRIIRTRPTSESRRIVIAGSSVAAGASAATYAQSWAGLLTTALEARGYTVINVSISGNSTQAIINRFYTDIAPLQPDFVIHNTGIPNDSNNFTTYTANIHRLIKMTEGIGAVPIVGSQYANNDDSATVCRQKQDLRDYFNKTGVAVIDFLSATANFSSDCDWFPGNFADALHPNSVGHQLMFSAIPLSLFDVAVDRLALPVAGSGVWQWGSSGTGTPLVTTLDTPADSWTWSAWVRGKDAAAAFVAMHVGGPLAAAGLRVRCTTTLDVWRLSATTPGFEIASTVQCGDSNWNHVAVAYHDANETFTFFINGVLAGTQTGAPFSPAQTFNTFFRSDAGPFIPNTGMISQLAIWRVALSAEQVRSLYFGRVHLGSLEFWSNFDGAPGVTLSNLAMTSTSTVVDWTTANGWAQSLSVRAMNGRPERYNQDPGADTGTATIDPQVKVYFCNTSSGAVTLTLPALPIYGEVHTIRNIGASVCPVNGNGFNINGSATATLAAGASATYRFYFGSPRQWFSF
jgi:lysophospholipase L1-like esterase